MATFAANHYLHLSHHLPIKNIHIVLRYTRCVSRNDLSFCRIKQNVNLTNRLAGLDSQTQIYIYQTFLFFKFVARNLKKKIQIKIKTKINYKMFFIKVLIWPLDPKQVFMVAVYDKVKPVVLTCMSGLNISNNAVIKISIVSIEWPRLHCSFFIFFFSSQYWLLNRFSASVRFEFTYWSGVQDTGYVRGVRLREDVLFFLIAYNVLSSSRSLRTITGNRTIRYNCTWTILCRRAPRNLFWGGMQTYIYIENYSIRYFKNI